MLIEIEGKHNGNQFTAGMEIVSGREPNTYYITKIAPILKLYFYSGTPLFMESLKHKCIKHGFTMKVVEITHGKEKN